jgi:N-methylhydantoinase B
MEVREKVDPITVAVLDNRFSTICEEIGETMARTSRSPIFSEARDMATSIFDKDLRLIAHRDYIPVLAGAAPPTMQEIASHYEGDINEGDIFIQNDPYAGNSHIPDLNVVKPVFYQGKLRFWCLSKGHQVDMGGGGVGGYNPAARDVWDEGIIIPTSKLYDKGKLNRGLLELILRNVHVPSLVEPDIYCQVAAVTTGERALLSMLEKWGVETVEAAVDMIIAAGEREMRQKISMIPDGIYYGERGADHDGVDRDKPVMVRVKLIKQGDEITVDWSETGPQVPGFMNVARGCAISISVLAIFYAVSGIVKINAGSLAPLKFKFAEGSVVNSTFPAPVALATMAGCEIMAEAIWVALSQAVPHWVSAGWSKGTCWGFAGFNPRTRMSFVRPWFMSWGGSGATEGFDGWDELAPIQCLGGLRKDDPELQELSMPVIVLAYEALPDRAGAGKWRGGNGQINRIKILIDDMQAVCTGLGLKEISLGPGLEGGKTGALGQHWLEKPDGTRIPQDVNTFLKVEKGDILEVQAQGGGGFGDPFERPIEKVWEDVRDELLSVEKAKEDYGVVIDPVTLEVDYKKTEELRGKRK